MPENRKSLPALNVPVAGYKLLRSFARHEDMSISEALRQLLKESPRLIQFAKEQGIDLDVLDVGSWGGSRDRDAESEDEPPTPLSLGRGAIAGPALERQVQGRPAPAKRLTGAAAEHLPLPEPHYEAVED